MCVCLCFLACCVLPNQPSLALAGVSRTHTHSLWKVVGFVVLFVAGLLLFLWCFDLTLSIATFVRLPKGVETKYKATSAEPWATHVEDTATTKCSQVCV